MIKIKIVERREELINGRGIDEKLKGGRREKKEKKKMRKKIVGKEIVKGVERMEKIEKKLEKRRIGNLKKGWNWKLLIGGRRRNL